MAVALKSFPAYAPAQSQPLNITVTVGMIADVVENVGGDCVEVLALMGPGVDPHLFKASAADVRAMQTADLIFYSGYSLEGQLGEVLARFGQQKPVVALAPASISPASLITTQDVYGIDPHLWMDVSLWRELVDTVANTLVDHRPECSDQLSANAQSYKLQLDALHGWVTRTIATIPERQRILVTAHDAFEYFGRAYGIEVDGIQGISTESEAGIADIRETVDLVVDREIPAIFIESTINPRTIEAVIEASAERDQEVSIGGQLFSDAMGQSGTADGTYIGMIYHNAVNITEALGGSVPPLPGALQTWTDRWGVRVDD
ncbi:MAG: zinc ABC transporter substrate-binding protein [Trueperaceae bacterium]|nr:MAG: zinc ABC transporter substrate-binding protein [Trueperaceae bacterium]